ncbi:S8 family peptidase [Asaccharospora irregularis]|uniref:Subtilase family protein n=1 Tax=Asaccharospora irregularis DSM 2635 TaxID=1121321 RepID=A0A1M5KCC3_9FIRM|nr:S8 family peptidase [Asaccharospora irregularis]SHG50506.1 Subtilase family protein [Asaccharospora irregularis DSM 2635]
MGDRNLPIKMVIPRGEDIKKNISGGGDRKFFCEVTEELKFNIVEKFENCLSYYKDVFDLNDKMPTVGKIKVKSEAIAKSHKPSGLCKKCPIIGGNELNEIYIKLTKKGIESTIETIKTSITKEIESNLTAIETIEPVTNEEKISKDIINLNNINKFDTVKNKIKITTFDFENEFDNNLIDNHIRSELTRIGLGSNMKTLIFGSNIKYIKVEVQSFEEIIQVANINGIKSIDFFQQYTSVQDENTIIDHVFDKDDIDEVVSDVVIGIIDSGISKENSHIEQWVYGREVFVPEPYQNPSHGTFVASTIQYGNILNEIDGDVNKRYRFLDVIAIPNGDENFGLTDTISEDELMYIIEQVVGKHHNKVKIWNLSLGIPNKVCDGSMSDLAVFCDYIQDKYNVQFIISSGNFLPLRNWPPEDHIGDHDRIISPADSVRAITVGSIAYKSDTNSIVKVNEPSPFSRRGPGANFIVKPDLVDYGGNCTSSLDCCGVGMKGMDIKGNLVEQIGTSYSAPRIVNKYASIVDELSTEDLLLSKAMIIHSARINSKNVLDINDESIKYVGFGMPSNKHDEILMCSENEITLVFKQKIVNGSHLELMDFPYPPSLINNNKYMGEIYMTLVYNPPLDINYGKEYCRSNIDVSFGTYKYDITGKPDFKGQVPLEKNWEDKHEYSQVENGFKWSPVKSYHRNISNGIKVTNGWKLKVSMTSRYNTPVPSQEFVLIVTIKDNTGKNYDIYSEVVSELRNQGFITNDLEIRQRVRQSY